MRLLLVFVALTFMLPVWALAEVRLVEPLRVTDGLANWRQATMERAIIWSSMRRSSYTVCSETREIARTWVCASGSRFQMNGLLIRASIYAEGLGSHKKGTIVTRDDSEVLKYIHTIAGQDLKSDDLLAFKDLVQDQCSKNDAYCLSPAEKEFFDRVITPISASGPFVVLAFGVTDNSYLDVMSHEIFHAQFFLQPLYRSVVEQFWKTSVTELDRKRVKTVLAEGYDANDDTLMANEFQAYIMMQGAETSLLKDVVPTYRQQLLDALATEKQMPILIQ